MTLTIDLTPEQENILSRQAQAAGIDQAEFIRSLIISVGKPGSSRPKTGAELADALEALNLSGSYGDPNIDAPELARQLAARFSRPNREAAQ